MNPIVEKERSYFVKCNYDEKNKFFEGHLPKNIAPSGEREISIASVSFQPKFNGERKPIEIGLSFGENGNVLVRLEKGE